MDALIARLGQLRASQSGSPESLRRLDEIQNLITLYAKHELTARNVFASSISLLLDDCQRQVEPAGKVGSTIIRGQIANAAIALGRKTYLNLNYNMEIGVIKFAANEGGAVFVFREVIGVDGKPTFVLDLENAPKYLKEKYSFPIAVATVELAIEVLDGGLFRNVVADVDRENNNNADRRVFVYAIDRK